MRISTEDIRVMRDQHVFDRKRLIYAPEKVKEKNEQMICMLNEILEFREACDAANGQQQQTGMLFAVPVEGTVS